MTDIFEDIRIRFNALHAERDSLREMLAKSEAWANKLETKCSEALREIEAALEFGYVADSSGGEMSVHRIGWELGGAKDKVLFAWRTRKGGKDGLGSDIRNQDSRDAGDNCVHDVHCDGDLVVGLAAQPPRQKPDPYKPDDDEAAPTPEHKPLFNRYVPNTFTQRPLQWDDGHKSYFYRSEDTRKRKRKRRNGYEWIRDGEYLYFGGPDDDPEPQQDNRVGAADRRGK